MCEEFDVLIIKHLLKNQIYILEMCLLLFLSYKLFIERQLPRNVFSTNSGLTAQPLVDLYWTASQMTRSGTDGLWMNE